MSFHFFFFHLTKFFFVDQFLIKLMANGVILLCYLSYNFNLQDKMEPLKRIKQIDNGDSGHGTILT